MRWTLLGGLLTLAALCLLLPGAKGESYTDWTIESDDTPVHRLGEDITISGDLIVNGTLTLENVNLTFDRAVINTTHEIRVNPGGRLTLLNTTATNLSAMGFDFVVDQAQLTVVNSSLHRTMLWLVGADVTLRDTLVSDLPGIRNYGLFIENTTLEADNVTLQHYPLGVRAIGMAPTLGDMHYLNCTQWMSQEWWLTLRLYDTATGQRLDRSRAAVVGDSVTRIAPLSLYDERTWPFWARDYLIDADGVHHNHTTSIELRLSDFIGDWADLRTTWSGRIVDNHHVVYEVNSDAGTELAFLDLALVPDHVRKWDPVTLYYNLTNPTDVNFTVVRIKLLINNVTQYFYLQDVALPPHTTLRGTLIWNASREGELSVSLMLDADTTPGADARINRLLVVGSRDDSDDGRSSGFWLAMLALLAVLGAGGYIIWRNLEPDEPETEPEAPDAQSEEERAAAEPAGDEIEPEGDDPAERDDEALDDDEVEDEEPADDDSEYADDNEADETKGDEGDDSTDDDTPDEGDDEERDDVETT